MSEYDVTEVNPNNVRERSFRTTFDVQGVPIDTNLNTRQMAEWGPLQFAIEAARWQKLCGSIDAAAGQLKADLEEQEARTRACAPDVMGKKPTRDQREDYARSDRDVVRLKKQTSALAAAAIRCEANVRLLERMFDMAREAEQREFSDAQLNAQLAAMRAPVAQS